MVLTLKSPKLDNTKKNNKFLTSKNKFLSKIFFKKNAL